MKRINLAGPEEPNAGANVTRIPKMDDITLRDKLNQIEERQEYLIDYQRDMMKVIQFVVLQNLALGNPGASVERSHEELAKIIQHLDLWGGKVINYDWMDEENAGWL